MKTVEFLLCFATGWLLVGCASSQKSARIDPEKIDWRERVGSYTYEQAVADLGKPAVTGESSDGKTAEWTLRHSPRMSFGVGVGGGSYGSHSGMGVGVGSGTSPPAHGANLRLTFDKEDKLKDWTKINY